MQRAGALGFRRDSTCGLGPFLSTYENNIDAMTRSKMTHLGVRPLPGATSRLSGVSTRGLYTHVRQEITCFHSSSGRNISHTTTVDDPRTTFMETSMVESHVTRAFQFIIGAFSFFILSMIRANVSRARQWYKCHIRAFSVFFSFFWCLLIF